MCGPAEAFPPEVSQVELRAGPAPVTIEVPEQDRPRTPLELAFTGGPAPHAIALRVGDAARIVLPWSAGHFRSPPLPAGDYEVLALARTVDGELLGPWSAGVVQHATDAALLHSIEVPRPARLRLTAAPASALRAVHVALPRFCAPVPDGDWSVQRRLVLAPGAAAASCALLPGDYTLVVVGGGAERHEHVHVASDATSVVPLEEQDVELARLRLVAGRPLVPSAPLELRVSTPAGSIELPLARGRSIEDGLELTLRLPRDATAVDALAPGLLGHASLEGPRVPSGPARLVEVRLVPR